MGRTQHLLRTPRRLAVLAFATWAAAPAGAEWRTESRFEEPRPGLAAAVLDGKLYAAGGIGLLAPSAALDVLEPGDTRWRALTPLPEGRARFAMAAVGGLLYASGGVTEADGVSDALLAYDPVADEWLELPALPAPRSGHVMAAVDGTLYVFGGAEPGVDVYAPDARRWTRRAAPAATARPGAAAAVLEGRIHLIGGLVDGVASARVDIYDPINDVWLRGPDLPEARAGLGAATLADAIHVFGGTDPADRQVAQDHYVLTAGAPAWAAAPPLPAPRTDFAAATVDGAIIMVGGGAGGGFLGPFTSIDAVDVFRQ